MGIAEGCLSVFSAGGGEQMGNSGNQKFFEFLSILPGGECIIGGVLFVFHDGGQEHGADCFGFESADRQIGPSAADIAGDRLRADIEKKEAQAGFFRGGTDFPYLRPFKIAIGIDFDEIAAFAVDRNPQSAALKQRPVTAFRGDADKLFLRERSSFRLRGAGDGKEREQKSSAKCGNPPCSFLRSPVHDFLLFQHLFELAEKIERIVRSRCGFRMVLNAEHRSRLMTESFDGSIVEVDMRDFDRIRQ